MSSKFTTIACILVASAGLHPEAMAATNALGFTRSQGPDLRFADIPAGYTQALNSVAIADFDGDGAEDVVGAFVVSAILAPPVNGRLRFAFGPFSQSTTATAPTQSLLIESGFPRLAARDLNNDGHADVVVAVAEPGDSATTISVFLVTTQTAAPLRTDYIVPWDIGYSGVATPLIADFDGDGDPDIFASSPANNAFVVLRNDGAGAFSAVTAGTVDPADRHHYWRPADLNGDGRLDLVGSTPASASTVIYQQLADHSFSYVKTIAAWAYEPFLADVDGDGDVDLFTNGAWWANGGGFAFTNVNQVQPVTGALQILIADLDGDGAPDVANNPTWVFPAAHSPCCTIVWRGMANSAASADAGNTFAFKLNSQNISSDLDHDGHREVVAFDTVGVITFYEGSFGPNTPPTLAVTPGFTLVSSGAVAISLVGSDPDQQGLTWRVVTPPTKGTATVFQTNILSSITTAAVLSYDPNADATGTDSFTVVANDGIEDSVPHTITMTMGFNGSGGGGGGGSGGGGGGALSVLELLAAALALSRRRRLRLPLRGGPRARARRCGRGKVEPCAVSPPGCC